MLDSIEFAFYVLNEQFGAQNGAFHNRESTPENTIVIASSVSNGGGASLQAAELDTTGLIDGVAVSEPVIQVRGPANTTLTVTRGSQSLTGFGRPLHDYVTLATCISPVRRCPRGLGAPGIRFLNRVRRPSLHR